MYTPTGRAGIIESGRVGVLVNVELMMRTMMGVKGALGRSVRVFMTSMNVASYVLQPYNTTTITTGTCTYYMPSACVCVCTTSAYTFLRLCVINQKKKKKMKKIEPRSKHTRGVRAIYRVIFCVIVGESTENRSSLLRRLLTTNFAPVS